MVKNRDEPFVLLLDLDGTMQGNVLPQIKEKDIYEFLNKLNKQNKQSSKLIYKDINLFNDMRRGLIRPYLQEALFEIKKKHPYVEIFVYTASSDNWGNFLLPKINRFLFGNKKIINKPYFTRKHCLINGKKSIELLKPILSKLLKNKYPTAKFDNIFLIDNNYVLNKEESNKLIYCPTYDMTILNCPLRNYNRTILNKYHKELSNFMYSTKVNNIDEFLRLYYEKSLKENIVIDKYNKHFRNDEYWLKVKNIFISYDKLQTQSSINRLIKTLNNIN